MSGFSGFSAGKALTVRDIEELLRSTLGEEICGTDSNDRMYDSIEGLWDYELDDSKRIAGEKGKKKKKKQQQQQQPQPQEHGSGLGWYSDAYDYWEAEENCPLTDDGVLGGYGKLTPADVKGSNAFLDALSSVRPSLKFERVADCGAGIGRVTKHLLLPRCGVVDLVEQSPRLINAAPAYVGEIGRDRMNLLTVGLQNFAPEPNTYDIIWIQWVIGHLHDLDFISFFRRCAAGLRPGGVIILKDNCVAEYTFVVDKADSSVARNGEYMQLLFLLSGLNVVMQDRQRDFPTELYPVMMWALEPIDKVEIPGP